ncbi:MAG TPA: hypothetical protein VMV94_04035 [Phycisphaerae bacterium]|nr:hypothetical protein [Phycisphaerae bacterium]
MPMESNESICARLAKVSQAACRKFGIPQVSEGRLNDALSNAVQPQKLLDNFAEVWRVSADQARAVLEEHGFGGMLARLQTAGAETLGDEAQAAALCQSPVFHLAEGQIGIRAFNPALNEPVRGSQAVLDVVAKSLAAFLPNARADALGVLYRHEPAAYAAKFLKEDAPKINAYVSKHFGATGPRYLVNSGIGANEQFNYFVAALANARPNRRTTWLLANSPKEVAQLPVDATVENTLFMEFSRSGITEETVKLHEFTPRTARRIVFANTGPLKALGERDGNLVLELPSEVSGRYGRNKTPILMAPMHVAGLDVRGYWATIEAACRAMDLGDRDSAPVVLAQFIRLQQLRRGINHIYVGTNDSLLRFSADEWCQYWNEGVNRDANDITMSRYLGLPRDSHMNLEAILGTSEHKMAIFLLRTGDVGSHPLLRGTADAHRPEHGGLTPAEVDLVLALANVKRCSEKMPTALISVDSPNLEVSAWLGQLWADTTLVYSRLIGVDPGSNPEVKAVRSRAAQWLSDKKAAFSLLE